MLDAIQRSYISRVIVEIRDSFDVPENIAGFIACQFALESAFGTSELAVKYSNHCGMKYSKLRVTTALSDSGVFAHYGSLSLCVVDYFLCLTFHHYDRRISSVTEFVQALSWYCPDKCYFSNILKLFKMYQS